MVGVLRRVESRGHCRVMVAVAGPYRIGLAGLGEPFQSILAHRFQYSVSRSVNEVFGHHKRFVDQ